MLLRNPAVTRSIVSKWYKHAHVRAWSGIFVVRFGAKKGIVTYTHVEPFLSARVLYTAANLESQHKMDPNTVYEVCLKHGKNERLTRM